MDCLKLIVVILLVYLLCFKKEGMSSERIKKIQERVKRKKAEAAKKALSAFKRAQEKAQAAKRVKLSLRGRKTDISRRVDAEVKPVGVAVSQSAITRPRTAKEVGRLSIGQQKLLDGNFQLTIPNWAAPKTVGSAIVNDVNLAGRPIAEMF